MKKGAKITLIVISSIILITGGSFGGILWYSARNIDYEMGDPIISGYISEIFPSYEGYILADVPLNVTNNGLFDILDLVITVEIYAQGFIIPLLNGVLLGEGSNVFGDILKEETWSGIFQLNLTEYIASLAISTGEMRIDVYFSLIMDFALFQIPVAHKLTQIEPWNGPF